MQPTQFSAAVIGAGAGGKLSMRGLTASRRFDFAAVADLRPEAQREATVLYPGIRTFATHQELFAALQPEVVCVSTWAPSHLAVTRAALELPLKGILVEKPLGDAYTAGKEILDHIRAKNLPMVVPHNLLVADHSRQVLQRVWDGEIGDLRLVEIENTSWDIINAGIHWLNFFVMLVQRDPVEWVLAACDTSTRTYRDGAQVETNAVTLAQTRGGVRVVMQTGDYVRILPQGKGALFRLVGTRGWLEFYGWESRYWLLNEKHPRGELIEVESSTQTGHTRHLLNLAAQIDRGEPDYAVAESSLMALEVCEAAYLSHRLRCQVNLPLNRFTRPAPNGWDPGKLYDPSLGGRDGRKLPPLSGG
jgi:predicted dehydrogenase